MSTNTNEKAKKAAGWVTGLLTGWGIPGTIARILAGAIVGAIATAAPLPAPAAPLVTSRPQTARWTTATA